MTRRPSPKGGNNQTREVVELIHSDVCGPMPVEWLAGSKFFVSFIDDSLRFTSVYFIKNKSEVFEIFKQFIAWAENITGTCRKILKSKNGSEYSSKEIGNFCNERRIKHDFTVARTPQ